ncbi:MAG: glucose-6-phosphate dehydrogenase assembly protein OpcA [Candidatus Xenobia bacterium]
MAVEAALASLLTDTVSWKAQSIHVGAIERELTLLWKGGVEMDESKRALPVTRTRVLNLFAVTQSSDRAQGIKATVAQLAGQHPSRSIILVSHPDGGEASLDAEIEAHRMKTGKEFDVSWEIIAVNAKGRAAFHLANVVTPLLVTDLPTFLWWNGEPPFESDLFQRTIDISDRVLLDSLSFTPPYDKNLPRLSKLVAARGDRVAFSDFNWTRLRPWLEFTTQCFDAAAHRQYLSGIEKVRVDYEAPKEDPDPNPLQALTYVGWLASRLGWDARPGRKRLPHGGWSLPMQVTGANRNVDVEINCRDTRRANSGDVSGVVIDCTWLGKAARFSISRPEEKGQAIISIELEGATPVSKTVEFGSDAEADLLIHELNIFDRDEAWEQAMHTASYLVGGGKPQAAKPQAAKKGGRK